MPLKGLAFQEGYPSAWQRMVAEHPDVAYGSSNRYQNWEVVDPEKWVPEGYVCARVDSRGPLPCASAPCAASSLIDAPPSAWYSAAVSV